MIIDFCKKFDKQYKKSTHALQRRIDVAIEKFRKNPFDPTLKNHPLKGRLKSKRAFSVTGNIRVVFKEFDDYVLVVMLDVGGHSKVYD